MQLDTLNLVDGLLDEYAIEVAIVGSNLGERVDITGIDQLTDATGIVHRLVFQRGQTIVEHCIGDVKHGVFEFGTMQLVVGHLDIGKLHALTTESVVKPVTVVEHVVSRDNGDQQHQ